MDRFGVVSMECLVMGEGGGNVTPFPTAVPGRLSGRKVSAFVWIVPVVASKAVELTGAPCCLGW